MTHLVPLVRKPPVGSVGITATTRLRHADLWEAAKKLGSQSALARQLGVSQTQLGEWVNLNDVPHCKPGSPRYQELDAKLYLVTGKSLDELFPKSLRDSVEFLAAPKKFERTQYVQAAALEHHAAATRDRLLSADPMEQAAQGELHEKVKQLLNSLSPREAQIIELRYGFRGGYSYSCEECGHILKITRERVRQIEAKAIRKLQMPSRSNQLSNHREVLPEPEEQPAQISPLSEQLKPKRRRRSNQT